MQINGRFIVGILVNRYSNADYWENFVGTNYTKCLRES